MLPGEKLSKPVKLQFDSLPPGKMDLCHKQGIAIYSPYQSDVASEYNSP